MDFSSFLDTLPGFLFDEPATSEGECIEIAEWKTVLEKIMGELKKEPQLMKKLKTLGGSSLCKDKYAFSGCLLTNSIVKKVIGEYAAKCKQQIKMGTNGKKNATKATSIRLQGNSLFVKKEYRAAFKMFTRALMFAKDEDEESPLLYANRSAVYFYLKQYENALEDIERAFKFGYGKIKPTGKLLIRKGFSLLALGRDDQVKELLDANLPANKDDPEFAQWQQLKKESANVNRQIDKRDITMSQFHDVPTVSKALTSEEVFHPHERFPWLNAKIDLRYDAEKGYSLVSKEEMKYGEVVALSKPYVNLDPKRDSYERCHYCMVPCFETPKYFSDNANLVHEPKLSPDSLRMVTPLACPECSNVLYCSEACRTAAWTAYHRFECSQMMVLSKIDSKSHLAIRMLYMFGSLEENSPTHQKNKKLMTFADPDALMIDQQAFSFVYSNPIAELSNLEMNIEHTLTGGFLLKLVQMSDMLNAPKSIDDREYIDQEGMACSFLFRLLYVVNGTAPFTDTITNRTVSPFPYLSVDGMKGILKHSCEATVATSSVLTESLESNVNLLYATGAISAGTVLTLEYEIEEQSNLDQPNIRKYHLGLQYSFDCNCSRCVREGRDTLDIPMGVFYPIACSVCGSLMVRSDGSYRCSSTDGCNFKYSVQQMKNVYERVTKMLEAKRNTSLSIQQSYRTLAPKVKQLKTAIESTAQLLYGRSTLLAHLYAHLAQCYLLLTIAPISSRYSGPIGDISPLTHTVHRGHLTNALLYTNKAIDILESMKQGPGVKTELAGQFWYVDGCLDFTVKFIDICQNEELLIEWQSPIEQVRHRCEALLKMTAYDTMLASSLAAKQ